MKNTLKGFILGCITTLILSTTIGFATGAFKTIDVYENNVEIYANGNKVDAPNFTYNDTTYVPLRAVLEKMACNISYDDATKTVEAYNNYIYFPDYPAYINENLSTSYPVVHNTVSDIVFVSVDALIGEGDFSMHPEENCVRFFDNDKYVGIDTSESSNTYNDTYDSTYYPSASSASYAALNFPLYLYSDEDTPVFLGKLTTNEYDRESVFNEYSDYGSKYSKTSIFNSYSDYGSRYGKYSAFYDYASNPPFIVDSNLNIVGRLTTNSKFADGVTWEELVLVLKDNNQ